MESVFRKPVAFILTLALIIGTFVFPSYADSSIYNEASLANGVDTSFEKQGDLSEVKSQSYDGARTLNSDSHSGRFSLKLGKSGLSGSVLCHIINYSIDLTKYNQVSVWVKPKGYNIPLTLYTKVAGVQTTVGSIEIANLKADVWQQVSLNLSSVAATTMGGLYTYAYPNKSLLVDDISFTKSLAKTETWNLNVSGSSNTLNTVFKYTNGTGITLKNKTTSPPSYESGAKVASIENPIYGGLTSIQIGSTSSEVGKSLIPSGGALYIDNVNSDSKLFSMGKDSNLIYYYNASTNYVEKKSLLKNTTSQIYYGSVSQVKTNEDGSLLALVIGTSLYVIDGPNGLVTINSSNVTKIGVGTIADLTLRGRIIYYICNNVLYEYDLDNAANTKIADYYISPGSSIDPSDASIVSGSPIYRYYYYVYYAGTSYNYELNIRRHDNFKPGNDVVIYSTPIYDGEVNKYSIVKANSSGSMILYKYTSGSVKTYYLVDNANNTATKVITLGTISDASYAPYFSCEQYFYKSGVLSYTSDQYKFDSSLSVNDGRAAYIENYSSIYMINKTLDYDKELLYQFSEQASINYKPSDNLVIDKVLFSNLPNQVFAQMSNGDVYSIDTRTKTCRLIIQNMIMYDALSGGRLLLADTSNLSRFIIYDPTSNTKDVFYLNNRSYQPAFTIQYFEESNTVCYLNNENKRQILALTGATTQDKYAFMLNSDYKWWVYKNNEWKTIYTGSGCPSIELMNSEGMTAAEVNAITEKDLLKLPENAKPNFLKIAVYFNSNTPYATPVLKSINVSTKDAEADLESKTAYGTRIKEYNKADFREVTAIHVTENKDSTDEIFYFLVADDTPYSIRDGEVCNIGMSATQLFGNVKTNYLDIMSYGMSAKEISDFPADLLKEILIADNTTDKFGIVAVIKTFNKDTKNVKLDYILESLQKRFDDTVTTVRIVLTDDALIQFSSGEVTKEEIEKFADWVMDRKYNRGPVFFTFHVGNEYKIINYYMIKMFSVE